jgi:hypothetical protein
MPLLFAGWHQIEGLRKQCEVIAEKQRERFQQSMQAANKNLLQVFRQNSRAGTAQTVMEGITMGTLAFNILDRVTGSWSMMGTDWGQGWLQPFVSTPMVC